MRIIFPFVLLFITLSCDDLNKASKDILIARVNNNYIYKSDIELLNLKFSSVNDSIVKVKSYIDNWAKNHLLYEKAILNISNEKKYVIDQLIDEYKFNL